jgi:hypothetical protein
VKAGRWWQALFAAGLLLAYLATRDHAPATLPPDAGPATAQARSDRLADDRGTRQVTGSGIVVRLLADDTDGDPHQRFILALPAGDTLLIAHNIRLAPRVDPLRVGDRIEFHGEYARNPRGGVVHWTHHDPAGRHEGGWLRRDGRVFQ